MKRVSQQQARKDLQSCLEEGGQMKSQALAVAADVGLMRDASLQLGGSEAPRTL